MNGKNGVCEVCGADGASHQFDMLKHSGGGAVYTCSECTKLAKRLAAGVKDEYCLWCLEETTGKYEWLAYGEEQAPRHRICGDCRHQIWTTGRPLTRGPRGGVE